MTARTLEERDGLGVQMILLVNFLLGRDTTRVVVCVKCSNVVVSERSSGSVVMREVVESAGDGLPQMVARESVLLVLASP